ncbi:MAG TPA: hypothetical protein VH833_12320 [Gemmatimonadales bacterium]|jgi:hypothetical protein
MNSLLPRFAVVATFALSAGLASPLTAQWGLALDLQRSAYGGGSKDTTSGGPAGSFRPGNARAVTLRLERRLGRAMVGLGARYVRSAIVLDAQDIYVGLRGEFNAFEALPEVRIRVARSKRGAALELYGNAVIGVWAFEDFGARAVPGATVGVAGEFPIFDRLTASLRIGGSVLRTVFREGELPPELVLRTMRRSEISLGLRYGR